MFNLLVNDKYLFEFPSVSGRITKFSKEEALLHAAGFMDNGIRITIVPVPSDIGPSYEHNSDCDCCACQFGLD